MRYRLLTMQNPHACLREDDEVTVVPWLSGTWAKVADLGVDGYPLRRWLKQTGIPTIDQCYLARRPLGQAPQG